MKRQLSPLVFLLGCGPLARQVWDQPAGPVCLSRPELPRIRLKPKFSVAEKVGVCSMAAPVLQDTRQPDDSRSLCRLVVAEQSLPRPTAGNGQRCRRTAVLPQLRRLRPLRPPTRRRRLRRLLQPLRRARPSRLWKRRGNLQYLGVALATSWGRPGRPPNLRLFSGFGCDFRWVLGSVGGGVFGTVPSGRGSWLSRAGSLRNEGFASDFGVGSSISRARPLL